jgi:hypothetical protein
MSVTVSNGASALIPCDMNAAIRMADLMSQGKLMPSHLQRQPGDCLMVIEQAMRWRMSPFAVAQATSVIQGKLMFEGKLVAAALHASGALATRLEYAYSGAGDDRMVTVYAILAGEDKPRTVEVRLREARTNNKVWTTQPDQQLAYHGARVWARRHAPEVMMGVYSPEEFEAPVAADTSPVIDAAPEPPPQRPAFGTVADAKTWCAERGEKMTGALYLEAIGAEFSVARTTEEVDALIARQDVQAALDNDRLRGPMDAIIKAALDRTAEEVA